MIPDFKATQRKGILQNILSQLDRIYENPRKELVVSKAFDALAVTKNAHKFKFDSPNEINVVMDHIIAGLKEHAVHPTHPSYLGLFNPRANFPSAMADIINSYLNPQLAAWSHAPFASEIERMVIKEFGKKFGYRKDRIDGTFCTGGAESNLTAVLCALQKYVPNISENGLVGLEKKPVIYASSESHHSIEKAAKTVGLGKSSVKMIPVNNDLTINIADLRKRIAKDSEQGLQPLMVVGTAGTTGSGAIDDLREIAIICRKHNLWFHVDAAYGGAAIITDLRHLFNGIASSDSITLDLHKWFSVPMATSLFLTSDLAILHQAFGVQTNYMPKDGDPKKVIDPYVHSLQWSRRFIGLKIYLPLAVFGWEGYTKIISHQIEMGNVLRTLLQESGWRIINNSELPIVCFTNPWLVDHPELVTPFIDDLNNSGETWISAYPLDGMLTLRACITNYNTQVEDLQKFVLLLGREKEKTLKVISSQKANHE